MTSSSLMDSMLRRNCPFYLRKIVSRDQKTGKTIELVTNHMTWAASTICSVYRDRWQIELSLRRSNRI
jgi:IS4 transposase